MDVLREPLPNAMAGVLCGMKENQGIRLSSQNEEEIARWLCAHSDRLDEILASKPGSSTASQLEIPPAVIEALTMPDATQIWNDFRDLVSDNPTRRITDTIQFTLDHCRVDEHSRVLDVGSSLGCHMFHLLPRSPALLIGLDYSLFPLALGSMAWTRQGTQQPRLWVWGNALDLPLRDSAVTHFHSFVTLSLLPVERALQEARRVLAPRGRLTITVEGFGYWQQLWDSTGGWGRARLARLRELSAFNLTKAGSGWQKVPILQKISRHTTFTPEAIAREITRAGFDVEKCVPISYREGKPRLIGLTATKRSS